MPEDEIEIQIGDVKVNPQAISPSPTGQLLELGENVLPSLAVEAGDTLANLASGIVDSKIVPESDVAGGSGSSLLQVGTTFSRGLVATEQKTPPSVVSGVAGEPTASQIEKVYDATNTCRSNAEIMKITGLNMNTVVACVAWLTKKGWIVTDDNKRACSIEAVGRYREKFKKICDWCNK